ncbi:microcin C transport system ATP-binding protein [Fluviicoccus keumensis]|uniref:Microcin C transport system ATP-binding protein n=1 Tax=Fluviicoccus keumensis TaxID=1435465 RepID=A0A4Q7YKP8_9GAMM|nr:ABC transporter ATP-binding protein [Fluviicoccus keumensis]RZU37089.1 microcin C transport system ATP-binding protein [Fluviicoccus keumensis]
MTLSTPASNKTGELLAIDRLTVRFAQHGQESTPVQAVSLSIQRGEMLAIVGESGSGKSLTALSILKLLPDNARCDGSIRLEGEELLAAPESRLQQVRGERVSMIFQEPMTSLNPLHTIGRQIDEIMMQHHPDTATAIRARTITLLEEVGIPDPTGRVNSYPHELSGGQRQRVMIAMALANRPALLIADEPTTALDVTLQEQILSLLRQLQQKLGLSVLLISHDLGLVRRFADKVGVMQQGRLVEMNATDTLFADPQHPYTRMLLAAEPEGQPAPVPADAATILTVDKLRIWFPIRKGFLKRTVGHIKAVTDLSLQLRQGETLGVVGESGSGKSTLAFAVTRLTEISDGRIVFLGREIHHLAQSVLRPMRKDLQIVFQDPYGSLSPRLSVGQIVAEGLELSTLTAEAREARVIEALTAVEMDPDTRHRYPHEFSGGQRQRIAIARALVLKPKVLILDEPTSALDRTVQKQIVLLLRRLQAELGFSCLFISHDLKVVRAVSHRVLVMRFGEMVETGDTETVFSNPVSDYTRQLMAAAFAGDHP